MGATVVGLVGSGLIGVLSSSGGLVVEVDGVVLTAACMVVGAPGVVCVVCSGLTVVIGACVCGPSEVGFVIPVVVGVVDVVSSVGVV